MASAYPLPTRLSGLAVFYGGVFANTAICRYKYRQMWRYSMDIRECDRTLGKEKIRLALRFADFFASLGI